MTFIYCHILTICKMQAYCNLSVYDRISATWSCSWVDVYRTRGSSYTCRDGRARARPYWCAERQSYVNFLHARQNKLPKQFLSSECWAQSWNQHRGATFIGMICQVFSQFPAVFLEIILPWIFKNGRFLHVSLLVYLPINWPWAGLNVSCQYAVTVSFVVCYWLLYCSHYLTTYLSNNCSLLGAATFVKLVSW